MIKLKDIQTMLIAGAKQVVRHEKYLCELDSFVGDGDHGVTAARGFSQAAALLEKTKFNSIGEMMRQVGKTLSDSMGGAIGPIMGSVFSGAGEYAGDKTALSVREFGAMMRAGCEKAKKLGGAKPGDKTLVDALEPAVSALEQGGDFMQTIGRAARAAMDGAEHTKNMEAKKGRARFLGERSKGQQDAGATTWAIFIHGMAEAEKKNSACDT